VIKGCLNGPMLRVGLTGGIGAGKSTVANRLAEHGAVLIDADRIAREVVAPGTSGLAEIQDAFGAEVIDADGELDRAALAAVAFGDEAARLRLNAIVHPRVGARTAELMAAARPEAIVVHDVPLLVEGGLAPGYHLVIVVDAPEEVRLRRLTSARGMDEADVRARMASQATAEQRRAAADVWLDNSGPQDVIDAEVDALWADRLVPFESKLRLRKPRPPRSPVVVAHDRTWPEQAERALARIRLAVGDAVERVDHIGSTAVPGLPAKDIIDLQAGAPTLAEADGLASALTEAGYPAMPGEWRDDPPADGGPDAGWPKRVHVGADPARPVNVHIRSRDNPVWRQALLFAAWLRDNPDERSDYADLKRRLARAHDADGAVDAYAADKAPWICSALGRAEEWARRTGWAP
jgi:dephospho-CoA kinase